MNIGDIPQELVANPEFLDLQWAFHQWFKKWWPAFSCVHANDILVYFSREKRFHKRQLEAYKWRTSCRSRSAAQACTLSKVKNSLFDYELCCQSGKRPGETSSEKELLADHGAKEKRSQWQKDPGEIAVPHLTEMYWQRRTLNWAWFL